MCCVFVEIRYDWPLIPRSVEHLRVTRLAEITVDVAAEALGWQMQPQRLGPGPCGQILQALRDSGRPHHQHEMLESTKLERGLPPAGPCVFSLRSG